MKADIYPHKKVEDTKVVEAANYVINAFRKFTDECDNAFKIGADESHIVCTPKPPKNRRYKLLAYKI